MDSEKPDFTGLFPPKQILRFQEVADRITGPTATAQIQALASAARDLHLDAFSEIDRVRARLEMANMGKTINVGALDTVRAQLDIAKKLHFPDTNIDFSKISQGFLFSTATKHALASHSLSDTGPASTSYLQTISSLVSSFPESEINRTLRKIGLLVAEVEEHRQVAPRPAEVQQSLERLREADTAEEFSGIFGTLPEVVGIILWVFLLKIAEASFDFVVNVAANMATPEVQALIDNPELSQREKVAKARSAPLEIAPEFKSHVRFINAERVNLRLEPSIKSTIVTVMSTGRVITILSKRRNWIEVTFADENGDEFEGWVFTRYTSRFR